MGYVTLSNEASCSKTGSVGLESVNQRTDVKVSKSVSMSELSTVFMLWFGKGLSWEKSKVTNVGVR